MTDTPASSSQAGGTAPAAKTNSPFHQPIVPAPDGGDKSPRIIRDKPAAVTPHDYARMTPAERFEHNRRPDPPVITQAEREAAHREGHTPRPQDPAQAADEAGPKIKVGDIEASESQIREALAEHAAKTSIKLTLPTPESYKAELPADFKAPEGVSYELDQADPAVKLAREFAHRNGLSQQAFSELAGIHAGLETQKAVQFKAAFDAEVGKLGATATARVTAVQTWMKAMMGPDAAAMARIFEMAPVASTIVAFEKLMQKLQGGVGFNQRGRELPETGLSDEQWNSMSYADKRQYARRGVERGGR